ncbi:MAG: heat-inducible transcriptional repressor HrcA [Candidatus Omnitrophica bacterium]|nr:heat-inducible transcriptional repressor HrcA [Candidatus Omnitrophota bacterium]
MTVNHLKSRSHKILEAIILTYAESATPVGSELLWERYDFQVSPATIRNAMAELESLGLITHPHTSAGRVPTDLGYRYYVDILMEPKRLTPQDEEKIRQLGSLGAEEPVEFLKQAAKTLSDLTQVAAIVLVPLLSDSSFRLLKLIPLGPDEVMAVLITGEGIVKHALLDFGELTETGLLEELESFLNGELAGMPLSKIPSYLESLTQQYAEKPISAMLIRTAQNLLARPPFLEQNTTLLLEGASKILHAPEFKDIEKARRLLSALENREGLVDILKRDLAGDEVKVHIGFENKGQFLEDCTIAAAPYRLRSGIAGALGVMGPTRMDYPRVTTLLTRMAQTVTRSFQERE